MAAHQSHRTIHSRTVIETATSGWHPESHQPMREPWRLQRHDDRHWCEAPIYRSAPQTGSRKTHQLPTRATRQHGREMGKPCPSTGAAQPQQLR